MKPLALLLIGFIVYLSAFPGTANSAIVHTAKEDCCKEMKMACKHQQKDSKSSGEACGQPGCTAMFSCSFCGFIVQAPLSIQPVYADYLSKPVARYILQNPAGYQPDNWKPPRIVN